MIPLFRDSGWRSVNHHKEFTLQSTLLHLEYMRSHARYVAPSAQRAVDRVSHPPPARPARRRAAELLARLAWRLDREAALRVWP